MQQLPWSTTTAAPNATYLLIISVYRLTFSDDVVDEAHAHPEVEEAAKVPRQLVEAR